MNEDPYESIIKECQITISQEVKLRKCGFAFEPEQEEPSPPGPVQLTGITMLSLPESDSEYVEEEIFHTPPEHHQSRSVSSSDDPGPESHQVGQKRDRDGFVVSDYDVSKAEVESKRQKADPQFTSKNVDLGETELLVIESEDVEMVETEVVDLSVEENRDEMGKNVNEETENVVEGAECSNARVRSCSTNQNVEDLDAVKYVSTGGVGSTRGGSKGVSVRRELPNSFKEPVENEGLWVPRRSSRDIETFKGLMDAAGLVTGNTTDADYIKAAEECGLIFDQPRWWPTEGFDGQDMD